LFKKWQVVDFKYPNIDAPKATGKRVRRKDKAKAPAEDPQVFLLPPYQKEIGLQDLIMKISEFRKQPGVHSKEGPLTLKRAIISEFPMLAKM